MDQPTAADWSRVHTADAGGRWITLTEWAAMGEVARGECMLLENVPLRLFRYGAVERFGKADQKALLTVQELHRRWEDQLQRGELVPPPSVVVGDVVFSETGRFTGWTVSMRRGIVTVRAGAKSVTVDGGFARALQSMRDTLDYGL